MYTKTALENEELKPTHAHTHIHTKPALTLLSYGRARHTTATTIQVIVT